MKKYTRSLLLFAVMLASGCAQMAWDKTTQTNTVRGYKNYLAKYPQGEYSSEATERIEELNWKWACDKNVVKSYEAYLKQYPKGTHAQEAKDNVEDLIWKQSQATNSIKQYESYLKH